MPNGTVLAREELGKYVHVSRSDDNAVELVFEYRNTGHELQQATVLLDGNALEGDISHGALHRLWAVVAGIPAADETFLVIDGMPTLMKE